MRTCPKPRQLLKHTKTLYFMGLLLSVPLVVKSQELVPTPTADEIRAARDQHADFKPEDFQPHMVDHPHQGCPVNSSCTQALGAARESFVSVLKSTSDKSAKALGRVITTTGVPMPVFVATASATHTTNYNNPNFIIWDSPCENHRMTHESVYPAEAIVKSMRDLKSLKEARPGLILVMPAKGSIKSFDTPRDHTPRYMDNDKLYFLLEEVGNYYGLAVTSKGDISAVDLSSDYPAPDHVSCPSELTSVYDQLPQDRRVAFSHYFCRSIYNTKTKLRELALLAWSCK